MNSSWRIFKAVAAKKAGGVKDLFKRKKTPQPVDRDLPLGLHINGKILLDQTPFLLWEDKMTIVFPGKEQQVAAYGKATIGDSYLHRFYLVSDDGRNQESMLQITCDIKNDIQECRLFRSMDEVVPESQEDWDFWLSEEDGSIGWQAFESKEGVLYDRAWDDSGDDHVLAIGFEETVHGDSAGEDTLKISHEAMLYGRWINEDDETAEYILLSAEDHGDEAFVHIMAGIDINPASIKTVY
ncbi:MAG: DUF2491 family protein [Deltaproteobacteria bacterium]|nr:DUF2491 family protein [Deltaproteobacteria bacterium]